MLIKNKMTRDPITVLTETSMLQASKLMKENGIHRLPVVDAEGKLIGIVSDRDIKEAQPSKATALEVHELYYLLSELKIKNIMTSSPTYVTAEDTVERAAMIMLDKRVGGLPVVDANLKVVGIITDTDIFRVFVEISGVRSGGVQFGVEISSEPGSLKPVLDKLRDTGARVATIVTNYEVEGPLRHVYIRILPMDAEQEATVRKALEDKYTILFWAKD